MTSLCLTTYIFGEQYQYYIPLLIYSLKRAYPDYYPLIFLHNRLKNNIKNILLNINSEIRGYEIVENYFSEHDITNTQKGASVRWILWHPEFLNFDNIYYIDADIFYILEKPSLSEQHLAHCNLLNLPYSNLIRRKKINFWHPRYLLERIKSFPFCEAIKFGIKPIKMSYRLTGLHFVKAKQYFQGVKEIIPKYREIIFSSRGFTHHPGGFNDESLLFDMVKESGIGLPPLPEEYGPHIFNYKYFKRVGFRPHHGIHLGIFRNKKSIEVYKNTLLLDFYIHYYQQYTSLRATDTILKYILDNSPQFITKQFAQIDRFYNENL